MIGQATDASDNPDHSPVPTPAVVLVAPQLGENIGMVARAMANFMLDDLRLVAPRDAWPNEAARKAASGADTLIDSARLFSSTSEAIAGMHWIAATTARPRDMAKPVLSPEQLVAELLRRLAAGQECAILFGGERAGLDNDDVALANAIVMAPVNPAFASLNLAQAVLLIGYEWMKQTAGPSLGRKTAFDGLAAAGPQFRRSRPATRQELLGLFQHLERELDASGFLRPPEKRPVMVRNIRNMLTRMEPTEQEIRTLRGIVASLTYAHRRDRERP